jgi:hypothetical protein
MLVLKHKRFWFDPWWTFPFMGSRKGCPSARSWWDQNHRREAEEFARRIGVENVVSITEDFSGMSPSVTIWYRDEQEAEPEAALADEFFETASYRD